MDETEKGTTSPADKIDESEPVIETDLKASKQPTICEICNIKNLTQQVLLRKCLSPECNRIYCIHFASTVDPNICSYCLSHITCTTEIGRAIHTTIDEDTGIQHSYTRRFKSIKFTGLDWLFQQQKIRDYDNNQLPVAIEYHRAILQGLLMEMDERKTSSYHRNRGKATPNVPGQMPFVLGIQGVKSSIATVKKVRKTKVVTALSPAEVSAQVADIMAQLLKKGMKIEDIVKAVK